MNRILEWLKELVWGASAPSTEYVDEYDNDYDYDDENEAPEVKTESDEEWQMPYSKGSSRDKRARQAQNSKVLEMYGKDGARGEVILRHPKDVSDAAKICEYVREEKMCVIDLTGLDRSMAQRIADFLGGACYAIHGTIQRISKDIFIIVPNGIRISADIRDELEKDGYIVPKTRR